MRKPKSIFEAFDSFGEIDFEPVPASAPCDARKGTWEQLECLRMRAERGESLYHKDDNPHIELDLEIRSIATDRMHVAKAQYTQTRRAEAEKLKAERRITRRKIRPSCQRKRSAAK